MLRLSDRLDGFAVALLDPDRSVPLGLVGPDGEPSAKRFAVYRNNVVVGLTEALQANYPVVCRIVGDEFFRAMARVYVILEPPSSPILLDYGVGFPNFVAQFEPVQPLPYLADVARIERAWTEAYHAPDAVPLSAETIAAVASDRIADAFFTVHPSLRIIRSPFPALTIWRMNVDDGVPEPVDLDAGGEDILVMRPEAEVVVRSMPPGGAEFIAALAGQEPLTEAAKSAMRADPHFDLAGNLATLIEAGIFVACVSPEQ